MNSSGLGEENELVEASVSTVFRLDIIVEDNRKLVEDIKKVTSCSPLASDDGESMRQVQLR